MDQQRLFEGAVEAMTLGAKYVPGEGWTLILRVRRAGEDWQQALHHQYDRLSTDELGTMLDVAVGQVFSELGL